MEVLETLPTASPVTTPGPAAGPRHSWSRPRLPAARSGLPPGLASTQAAPAAAAAGRGTGAGSPPPAGRPGSGGEGGAAAPHTRTCPKGKWRHRPSGPAATPHPPARAREPPSRSGRAACARGGRGEGPGPPHRPAGRYNRPHLPLGKRRRSERGGKARRSPPLRSGWRRRGRPRPPCATACEGAAPAERAERGGSGRRGGSGGRRGAGQGGPRRARPPARAFCAAPSQPVSAEGRGGGGGGGGSRPGGV